MKPATLPFPKRGSGDRRSVRTGTRPMTTHFAAHRRALKQIESQCARWTLNSHYLFRGWLFLFNFYLLPRAPLPGNGGKGWKGRVRGPLGLGRLEGNRRKVAETRWKIEFGVMVGAVTNRTTLLAPFCLPLVSQ